MDATELFLRDHARTHAVGVGEAEAGMYLENLVLDNVTNEQAHQRPAENTNSLAWIFWHLARSEDMGVNVIVAGLPQVIEEDGWVDRLGLTRHDIGTGMTDDECAGFSVDIAKLRAYRAAVGRRTREVVQGLPPEKWSEVQDPEGMRRALDKGALAPSGAWIADFFGGKSNALILGHVGTGHNFWHIGEAATVRSLIGLRLPV